MFVAPAYAVALAFRNSDSSVWLLFLVALLFGSSFGGYAAARDLTTKNPLSHGAVAAGCGLGIVIAGALLFQAIQGDLTLAASLTALVFLQIGIGLGCLGGLLASKGYGR